MGKNPSLSKGPQFPVEHAAFADILEFCRILSQQKWRHGAAADRRRVGIRRPRRHVQPLPLGEVPRPDRSETGSPHHTTPVKSRKPNAWGLYDMLCGGWHVTGDYKADNVRIRQVDPTGPTSRRQGGPPRRERTPAQDAGGPHYDHSRPNIHGAATEDGRLWEAGAMIFRVVVETGPARK